MGEPQQHSTDGETEAQRGSNLFKVVLCINGNSRLEKRFPSSYDIVVDSFPSYPFL